MSFIESPLGDAQEKEVMPEGSYDLIVEDAQLIDEPGKKRRISIRHSIDGHPEAKAVFHNIFLDLSDDAEKRNNQLLFQRAYLNAFAIPYEAGGFDLDDIIGARGTVNLTQDEYEGRVSNNIKLSI